MCLQLQGAVWEGGGYNNPKMHPKASLCPLGTTVAPTGPPPLVSGLPDLCTLPPALQGPGACSFSSLLPQRGAECAPHFLVGTVKLAGKVLKTIGAQQKMRKMSPLSQWLW